MEVEAQARQLWADNAGMRFSASMTLASTASFVDEA
jgi:hypothetical protein